MICRRSFLTALCALPVVGKFIQKPGIVPITLCEPASVEIIIEPIVIDGRTVGFQRITEYDQWPTSARAERIKAGRPVL